MTLQNGESLEGFWYHDVMSSNFRSFPAIAIYTFVPWAVLLFVLTIAMDLPRAFFLFLHFVGAIFVFALVFHFYFEVHPSASAFDTTAKSVFALVIFDAIFLGFFAFEPMRFLTYVDWILPTFLIATTIYAVGRSSAFKRS